MKKIRRPLLALLALVAAALAAGCHTPKDSSIPWSRPASWEGQVPGMTSGGDTSGTR